ncbi:MAG: FxsA family protein [Rhodospirillales bacterium]|nr:FxsA family protein [Rhodospirillales bacterium]
MLELALLIKIGQWIGVWTTVALVVTMAFTGILIISQQSFTVLRRTLESASEGRPPVAPVLDGLFLMVAGALFLTPGLMTDVLALLLLVPPIRQAVARWSIGHLLRTRMDLGDEDERAPEERHRPASSPEGPVIEGEFERLGETSTASRRGNGASLS